MVEFITVVYLFYIFISLYFLTLYILIYFPNRKDFFSFPKPEREYSLSMVVPCYNGEKDIGRTIETLLKSDYPGLKKIIVVDDCSTDNSNSIIKKYADKYEKVQLVRTPSNTGNAAGAKNFGAKFVKTDLIGFTDDDSFPAQDAISRMVGFFNEEKVGAVTSGILVKNDRRTFLERFQAIEYRIIVFTRKLLGFVDAIYVTPGPLAMYRKSVFDEVTGFDEKNMTEDIEITWHLIKKGYLIRMSPYARVFTTAPDKWKVWFRQRIRWNIGGVQTVNKYKSAFLKKGMLGSFVLPFFVSSLLIGVSGIVVLLYRLIRTLVVRFLSTSYSIQAQTAIITFNDINLHPNVLLLFGVLLMVVGLAFTLVALKYTRPPEGEFKKIGPISLIGYLFVYLLTQAILLAVSIYKMMFKKNYSW